MRVTVWTYTQAPARFMTNARRSRSKLLAIDDLAVKAPPRYSEGKIGETGVEYQEKYTREAVKKLRGGPEGRPGMASLAARRHARAPPWPPL